MDGYSTLCSDPAFFCAECWREHENAAATILLCALLPIPGHKLSGITHPSTRIMYGGACQRGPRLVGNLQHRQLPGEESTFQKSSNLATREKREWVPASSCCRVRLTLLHWGAARLDARPDCLPCPATSPLRLSETVDRPIVSDHLVPNIHSWLSSMKSFRRGARGEMSGGQAGRFRARISGAVMRRTRFRSDRRCRSLTCSLPRSSPDQLCQSHEVHTRAQITRSVA
jgi:hypothetical protein